MDENELKAWTDFTDGSADRWTVDPVHDGSREDLLLFVGGRSGRFIHAYHEDMIVGRYEDAVPHIGEASFTVLYREAHGSYGKVLARISELYGSGFIAGAKR